MNDNGFSKASPSGNHLVDGFVEVDYAKKQAQREADEEYEEEDENE